MLYLGIDSSTQGVKGVIIDPERKNITAEAAVNFGKDLPQYHSPNGFLEQENPLIRQSDPKMWLDGLELMLKRFQDGGVPMDQIAAISGSGQQHGSVYLNAEAETVLGNLNREQTLSEQLASCFSRKLSPIWMDRSTEQECAELTAQFGEQLQKITGSPATERFTGPQIRKFYKEQPEDYANTAKIHLVSSFLCTVLIGKHAPIDYGDGAGMNLLDLSTLDYHKEITEFTAPGLMQKLPPAAASDTIAGELVPYFEKYGLKSGIPVIVWSGDNPNSLIGTGCFEPGIAGISLGTSDTVFATMKEFCTDPEGCGHIMGNPAGGFMSLICFTNGSLAREKIRETAKVDWNTFDAMSSGTENPDYHLLLPYFDAESTPLQLKSGPRYNFDQTAEPPEKLIRALLESQALSMKLHTSWLKDPIRKIRLTGGASACKGFRQIIADTFQAEVETISVSNSAGLGAAFRAANGAGKIPFPELISAFCSAAETVYPDRMMQKHYEKALCIYKQMESER